MKKKIVTIIVIILFLILLIPVPLRMKDGGTVKYNAILYQIEDVHHLNPDKSSENEYIDGVIIKIFGIEVYSRIG